MTTADLLTKTMSLAKERVIDPAWCADKVEKVRAGEGRIVTAQLIVEEYEKDRASIVLDGTERTLGLARTAQQLLVSARWELALYQRAVAAAVEELEMAVLLAEHRKAAAALKETRA